MIKSMTGFGRAEYSDGKRNITVEIRTVNHRYSDITIKMPRRYSFAEDKIKNKIKETIVRGKADVSIMVDNLTENDLNVTLNTMVEYAKEQGSERIVGEYIPTLKNGMVKEHYPHLGFRAIGENLYELDVNACAPRECYIKRK